MANDAQDLPHKTGIYFYQQDLEAINAVIGMGLKHGIRLKMAQVVRMWVRRGQPSSLTKDDLLKAFQDESASKEAPKKRLKV